MNHFQRYLYSVPAAAGQRGERDAAAHFGYLAEQTAKLAMQRSRAVDAEARVAAAQGERDKVLLQARPTERGTVLTLGGDVLFATGRAELKSGAERMIGQVQRFLEENPERRVRIEGFTDTTGSDELNLDLSRRRAEAVARALESRGIDRSRIQTSGFAEAYPVADNASSGGRQLNRRMEIIIGNSSAEVAGR